jgi:hypothetical protein
MAVEVCITRVEAAVRRRYPEVISIYIKPQSETTWRARVEQIPHPRAGSE